SRKSIAILSPCTLMMFSSISSFHAVALQALYRRLHLASDTSPPWLQYKEQRLINKPCASNPHKVISPSFHSDTLNLKYGKSFAISHQKSLVSVSFIAPLFSHCSLGDCRRPPYRTF